MLKEAPAFLKRTEMFREWNPQPAPVWVTCVPSLRHPDLVPDFARRLAAALGLPFHEVLRKTDARPEQKTMANSNQQARNIDGSLAKGNREPLREGRLVLISAYDPAAGLNVGHAMQRNKAIYALSDAGLVVTSDFQKGGTWAGAIEKLEKYHFVPVFVRNSSASSKGNVALLQRGGVAWPEPHNGDELLLAMADARQAMEQIICCSTRIVS